MPSVPGAAHKDASGCSGKRDRTAFVGRGEFDERTFMSDYRFLEDVQLAEDIAKRSKPPAPKLDMPQFLQTLVYQARRRGIQLHILPPGMEKRRTNSTRYDGRQQTLYWHIDWRFPAADVGASSLKVHENRVVADLLRSHLALQPGAAARHHAVREYNEAGLEALTVVMRKERTPANAAEYFEIDITRPLRQQLAGKVVVEYPTLLVLLPHEKERYCIVAPPADEGSGGQGREAGAVAREGEEGTLVARAAAAAAAAAAIEGEEATLVAGAAAAREGMEETSAAGAGDAAALAAASGKEVTLAV
ncbi:Box C/D snoRNA protein 1 [Chlorella vulgaris]